MGQMITRQPVPATSIDPTTHLPPTVTQKSGVAPPPAGIYNVTVDSYDAGTFKTTVTSTDYNITFDITNGSGQTLTPGMIVTVLMLKNKPTSADQITGVVAP